MAGLNQDHVALVARHHAGIGRLLAQSKLAPEKILFIIAHVESKVGRGFVDAGLVPSPGRSSIVIPTSIDAAPMFAEALGHPEVSRLIEVHRATPIVVIDRRGNVGVTFEKFSSSNSVVDRPAS